MSEAEKSPNQIVKDLISQIRSEAGQSGAEEILKSLRSLDVYALGDLVEYPQPMFFADAWAELLEVLIAEAKKP